MKKIPELQAAEITTARQLLALHLELAKVKGDGHFDESASEQRKAIKKEIFVLRMKRGKIWKKLNELYAERAWQAVVQLDLFAQ